MSTDSVKITQADREHARRIVAEHYGYDDVEKVSLDCAEVKFFLKGLKVGRSRLETCDHNWRSSDSSLYDFKCTKCGETE